MPVPFVDFPAANDHAPCFSPMAIPCAMLGQSPVNGRISLPVDESKDNGATWSEDYFPRFQNVPDRTASADQQRISRERWNNVCAVTPPGELGALDQR